MARTGSMMAWLAGGAVALLLALPATAHACDAHAAAVKAPAEAKLTQETKRAEKAEPAKVVAEKCKCDGPGDCTCAKGKCQCGKCGNGRSRYKVMESLREQRDTHELPVRRNAAAGAFI